MINFEEELKKFTPILEIEDLEDDIFNDDMIDIIDLLKDIAKENKEM